MAQTTIVKCSCEHKFQDETYGKGKRVANIDAKGRDATCTVCGKKHAIV